MPSCAFMFWWSSAAVHVFGIGMPAGTFAGSIGAGGGGWTFPCAASEIPRTTAAARVRTVMTGSVAWGILRGMPRFVFLAAAAVLLGLVAQDAPRRTPWMYGGGPQQIRYSS